MEQNAAGNTVGRGEVKIRCSHDETVELNSLKPNPKNRNFHSKEQIERLADIIAYQGQRSPIVVSRRSGLVVKGHGRLEAIKSLGWTHAAVNFQEYDSDEQEYADSVADNSIASWAELDLSGINADLPGLGPDFDLDMLGIKDFNLDFLPGTEDDQGQLDKKLVTIMKCPHCGESFEKDQAEIVG